MSRHRLHAAVAALSTAAALGTLTLPDARATNLILNGDFSGGQSGWTFSPSVNFYPIIGDAYVYAGPDAFAPDNALGIYNYLQLYCAGVCPTGVDTASQSISSLMTGHSYQLTFYATAFNNLGKDYFSMNDLGFGSAGPLYVSLDGITPTLITDVPYYTGNPQGPGWIKETIDFNYLGASSSALLSFIYHYTGAPCVPCMSGAQYLGVALADLEDLTPPPPPPPPTQLPEPSSLLLLGLGLGVMCCALRRRGKPGLRLAGDHRLHQGGELGQ